MVTDPTSQSSVPLVRHDLSDLGSEILIRILPKERTLNLSLARKYCQATLVLLDSRLDIIVRASEI